MVVVVMVMVVMVVVMVMVMGSFRVFQKPRHPNNAPTMNMSAAHPSMIPMLLLGVQNGRGFFGSLVRLQVHGLSCWY